jgi:Flp pilus assembly CpaF family ATPase
MVGEIRDLETADIAIKAAQTGHLVLSTIHTNDAPSTLTRLRNMGVRSLSTSHPASSSSPPSDWRGGYAPTAKRPWTCRVKR